MSRGAGTIMGAACAGTSEAARLIEASDGGLVIPPGDDAALADVILRVKAGAVDAEAHRAKARRFAVRMFDRAAVYGQVCERLWHHGNGGPVAARSSLDQEAME